MEKIQKGNLDIFRFQNLGKFSDIDHFVSGRAGGYSKGPFRSLNTGFHVGDNDWTVLQNRKKLAAALGAELDQLTFGSQTHSSNIAIVDACRKGKGGAEHETAIPNSDGLITNTPNVYLCVQVADCVPILLYDPRQRVIAALHAGWRGTLRKIAEAGVKMMMHTYGSCPSDILAAIGPSNGPCCYEVGEDVKQETLRSLGSLHDIITEAPNPGKYIFNQWKANYKQILECGVPEQNIEVSALCNHCHSDLFFSSRKDNGLTGRYAAGIILR